MGGVKGLLVHPDAKRSKYDGIENAFLGYGTSRDKLGYGAFTMSTRLDDAELFALYYSDDIAAKIVNKKPSEMLRRGYKFVSKKNPKGAELLQKKAETAPIQLGRKILRGSQWGRLWGGAVAVMGANDSADLTKPLDPLRARDVKFLNVVDRRYVAVLSWQEDPNLPGFGEPAVYNIGGIGLVPVKQVHASRLIRFVGVEETDPVTVRQLAGWTHSALQRPYDVVRDFATAFKSVNHLLSDASQGVWKIQNLIEMLGANRDELMTRLVFSDMTRSAGRAIMLDAETEDYQRVPTSFAGISDVLDHVIQRLSSASDLPTTLLMGRSPAGMNATGESDFRAWYDVLETERTDNMKPHFIQAGNVLSQGQIEDLDVEFPPLWQATAQEKATTEKAIADTDKVYFDMGLPYESILKARFGSGAGKIEVDEEALDVSLEHEIELMKDPEAKAERDMALAKAAAPAVSAESKDPTDNGDAKAKKPKPASE